MTAISLQILENKLMSKFLIFFHKKALKKKIALQSKNVIALNIYIDIIDINELVYKRRLMMKVFTMTKFLC